MYTEEPRSKRHSILEVPSPKCGISRIKSFIGPDSWFKLGSYVHKLSPDMYKKRGSIVRKLKPESTGNRQRISLRTK